MFYCVREYDDAVCTSAVQTTECRLIVYKSIGFIVGDRGQENIRYVRICVWELSQSRVFVVWSIYGRLYKVAGV